MKKNLFLLLLSVLIQVNCFSQLTVTTNSVATSLAQAIAGSGLTVTTASLNCDKKGAGTFSYSGATMSITSGVLLTTGYASEAANPATYFCDEETGNFYSDPHLTTIQSDAINDACILTFVFTPLCNKISITFSFGSEEYPQYECSVNDAFGIFLTGANPAGGNYPTGTNFALLPNGTAVSINNINDGNLQGSCSSAHNAAYFQANYSGTDIAYGGLTKAITSTCSVVPCSNYTMEIAIADSEDELYDSGVFIQANSISCASTPSITTSSTAANCGTPGSATVTVTNYTATPTYSWSPGGATTASISNLTPGTYTCLVGLESGCGTTTQTVTAVVGSVGATFTYSTTTQNPLCANGTNGSAGVVVAGGAAPYTYTWTSTPPQNTATTTASLPAGTYTVSVKDNTGCIGTTIVTLTNPPAIVATVTTAPTTCTGSTGSATATVTSGGTAPFTYIWNTGAPGQTITNLATGSYTVGISDVNTCTAVATGSVGVQGFTWVLSATSTNPLCTGYPDGTATVSITNPGASTFTYSWTTTPAQTTSVTTASLLAGSYTVSVTDNNGCVSTASVTLVDPPSIVATVTTAPTICTGSTGSATALVTSGGTAPFTYLWNTGAPGQTITNLATGSYSVGVLDVNTCTAVATGSVGVQGFTWSASAAATNPTCVGFADGTATVSITNPGVSTFTYSWTTTPVQTTSVTTASLLAGNYTASVIDNNGCISTASVTLTDPLPVVATVTTSPTMCTGSIGSATATVISGGTGPYTYTWNTGASGQTATSLAQGTYTVAISDANTCTAVATGSVSTQAITWTAVATASTTKCYGSSDGTATVDVTNAPAGDTYTYTWTPTGQTAATATNLAIGNYTVTVKDINGCISTAPTTVTQPTSLVLTTQSNAAICTSNSGAASVTASGGTAPYTYTWTTVTPVQNTQSAIGLFPGNYMVSVSDINNCLATTQATVRDTVDLTVTASSSPDLCSKGVGKAIANPKGFAPYTYTWTTNPIQNTQVADNLPVGSYSVIVTDGYGCVGSASTMVINKNDVLSADFAVTPAGVINAEDPVTLNVTTYGGWNVDTMGYLSNGVLITSNPFPYIFPQYGNYTATYYFTSNNGCKDTATYNINVKDYITLYIPSAFSPNGDGTNDNFEAQGTFINTFEMYIYDRWGVLVKKMDNINDTWDGTKNGGHAPEDTYVYKRSCFRYFWQAYYFSWANKSYQVVYILNPAISILN